MLIDLHELLDFTNCVTLFDIFFIKCRIDEPDRIDLAGVVEHTTRSANARGRLITGSKIHGVKKEFLSHYTPDSDGKFRYG